MWRSLDPPQTRDDEDRWVASVSVQTRTRYVRVVGALSKFGRANRPSINALSVQPVENFNEVLHHALAAAVATMWEERSAPVRV